MGINHWSSLQIILVTWSVFPKYLWLNGPQFDGLGLKHGCVLVSTDWQRSFCCLSSGKIRILQWNYNNDTLWGNTYVLNIYECRCSLCVGAFDNWYLNPDCQLKSTWEGNYAFKIVDVTDLLSSSQEFEIKIQKVFLFNTEVIIFIFKY